MNEAEENQRRINRLRAIEDATGRTSGNKTGHATEIQKRMERENAEKLRARP
jgi:hypothetical protein